MSTKTSKVIYISTKTGEEMRWHYEQRVLEENILTHLADSLVWKDFDAKHPHFASDLRNIRLGLRQIDLIPLAI